MNLESVQEGPYELPEGWVWTQIKEVLQSVQQFNPRATPQKIYRYVDVSSISNRLFEIEAQKIVTGAEAPTRARQAIRPGDVLFSTVRPYLRNVAMLRSESEGDVGSTAFCVLRSNGCVEPRYLYRWTLTNDFFDDLLPKQRGISYPAIRDVDVRSQSIPLAPLPEQRRIVAKIEALFGQSRTARQALDRIPPLLKKFRQSVLAAAFRGDLTRDWREEHSDVEPASVLLERIRAERRLKWEEDLRARGKDPRKTKYEEPNPVDIGELPKLPEQWVWTNVGRLATPEPYALVDGPFGSNLKTADYVEKGVRVIRLQNIGESEFKDRDYAFISRAKFETLQKHKICPGDLIFATLGDPVARVCRFPVDHPVALVKADCIRFKVDAACAKSLYVMWALNTVDAHKRAEAAAHGIGRLRVNLNEIKQLPVPLAPPLEQRQIVAIIKDFFHQADAIEAAVEAARRRAEKLEQSILARAFRGELVPQDPNDEPASILLDRSWGERERSTIKTNTRFKGKGVKYLEARPMGELSQDQDYAIRG